MSWYKLQGDIRYIIQFLCKTDLEEIIVNSVQYCASDKIKKNEMGGAYGAYGGGERRVQGFGGET